jgi:4-hydroxy-3-methylbut-2-enyl diphosphate reductase
MQLQKRKVMKKLDIILINPRGFCAGVDRAIEIVEKSLEKFGKPLYVRHEIVHNKVIVENFKKRGVIFVEEVAQIPTGSTAIFSAHGVAKVVENEAKEKSLNYLDATCPLVTKVHKAGIDYKSKGYEIILIGHVNHPEVVGTMGRIEPPVYLVSSISDVTNLNIESDKIAFITQTTLSMLDTKDIIDALQHKFPNIEGLDNKNICYATQNRQMAVLDVINDVDSLIVIGSQNSSNSKRLKEIGDNYNKPSFLIDTIINIPLDALNSCKTVAVTAGASAPEYLVQEIILEIKKHYDTSIKEHHYTEENVVFHLPKQLR